MKCRDFMVGEKILGNICTEKMEYMYVAIEKCNELCDFVHIKKRKLAKEFLTNFRDLFEQAKYLIY